MHGKINCLVCGKSCEGSCTFHCGEKTCDFTIHLHCGPLPRIIIKHASHVHPLILKDYYVEDNVSDEFACHVCEEGRDPRLQVYYCSQGCLMTCDVNCVLNEVLPLLRGERGEVELRTPFPQVECRVINKRSAFGELNLDSTIEGVGDGTEKTNHVFSLDELFESYNDSESEQEDEPSDESSEESSITRTKLDEEADNYSFSWKALSHFEKSLFAPPDDISFEFLQQYDGDIMTGAHALPEILDPIYKEFFGMYNIIKHNKRELDYHSKQFLVFVTVAVLRQMLKIKVVDVTRETILQWFQLIGFIKKRGKFNVGFVAENMKRAWKAHYYIQAKKIVDDKTSRLERELEQVSMYEAELRTKLDQAKARHRELKLMAKEHDAYTIIGARGPMKKARSDALEIKWRTCYESLVTHPGNAPAK